jgi:lipopolysaccharide biosynthesis regulator YciM
VHQHLLSRADLKVAERDRAQYALAQDYMKAGLFDRAEAAYRALAGTPFDNEAQLALLALFERSRDWRAAVEVALRLEQGGGGGSFASRIAHYQCELTLEADARGDSDEADTLLDRARHAAPQAARPLVLLGQRQARAGRPAQALETWTLLRQVGPASFSLVAADFVTAALACGRRDAARALIEPLYRELGSMDLLRALMRLDEGESPSPARLVQHLAQYPTLSAAEALLARPAAEWGDEGLSGVRVAVQRAAKPLQRYRCAACGFEAQHYFWQCPGCLNWDSYPPQRIEEL